MSCPLRRTPSRHGAGRPSGARRGRRLMATPGREQRSMGLTIKRAVVIDRPPDELRTGWAGFMAPTAHRGTVAFEALPDGRGTVMRLRLDYDPPGGLAG